MRVCWPGGGGGSKCLVNKIIIIRDRTTNRRKLDKKVKVGRGKLWHSGKNSRDGRKNTGMRK